MRWVPALTRASHSRSALAGFCDVLNVCGRKRRAVETRGKTLMNHSYESRLVEHSVARARPRDGKI